MTLELGVAIGIFILGGLFTVLWWLLRQKDSAQQAQITELFALHKEDSERLQLLQLKISDEHYRKVELDTRFDKIDTTLKDGFKELGVKHDHLNMLLVQYLGKRPAGGSD